jgi:hypothetical protein
MKRAWQGTTKGHVNRFASSMRGKSMFDVSTLDPKDI